MAKLHPRVLDTIKVLAPALGTAIAPGIGTVVGGLAAEVLGNVLGEKGKTPEITIERINSRVLKDIQTIEGEGRLDAALRGADAEFAKALLEHDVALLRLDNDDRADARKREVATGDWFPKLLALLIVATFAASVAAMWTVPMVDGTRDMVMISIGVINTAFGAVVTYYLGSSAGSKASGEVVRKIAAGGR
ncbi:hypothetical protein [Geminicoccus harenae]|uniref:hypothetical protein n=1 Tax=Geminicoccus harenae TaxID=2498453 RepID=UPI00168BB482|nr:hypothetical protein [Geminicoccus harenae]